VIGGQQGYIAAVFHDIHYQGVQNPFWPDLDKNTPAQFVERVYPLDELHRRSHLLRQDVQNLFARIGIDLAGDIGDDWQLRGVNIHSGDNPAQRFAGWRHDARVEGVRDRDFCRLQSGGLEQRDRFLHRRGVPADDALQRAVDVGDHHIAVHFLQHRFHLSQRGGHGRHAAVVFHRDLRHFLAARADHP